MIRLITVYAHNMHIIIIYMYDNTVYYYYYNLYDWPCSNNQSARKLLNSIINTNQGRSQKKYLGEKTTCQFLKASVIDRALKWKISEKVWLYDHNAVVTFVVADNNRIFIAGNANWESE